MSILEPFHALMRRLMPPDGDAVIKPGAFGIYFEGPLWWMLQDAYRYHDLIDTRIDKGLSTMTHEENDLKFLEACRKIRALHADELTGAQAMWADQVIDWGWLDIRIVRWLRGEK